jgi:polyhydroxyalkanoate synthesis regulator phasin
MMEKLFKKVLYTGVGIFAATTERLQNAIDELVERGKLSQEEGQKVVEDVVKNTEHKKEEYESRFRRLIDSAISKLNLPQSDTHDKLEKRVKSLEVKLGLLTKELEANKAKANPSAAATKKSSRSKKTETSETEVTE